MIISHLNPSILRKANHQPYGLIVQKYHIDFLTPKINCSSLLLLAWLLLISQLRCCAISILKREWKIIAGWSFVYILPDVFQIKMSATDGDGIEMKSLEDELRKAFELFDEDKDGEITLGELARIMETHGLRPSQEELQRMIGSADTNR